MKFSLNKKIVGSDLFVRAAFLLLSVFVVSCGKSDELVDRKPKLPLAKGERTVIVYVVGDNGANELSSLLLTNIEDMRRGMMGVDMERFRLLVYSEMASAMPCLIHMRENNRNEIVMDTVRVYSERNPLKKSVMMDVFATVVENFPSDEYGLAFLSHSSSWLPAQRDANGRKASLGLYRGMGMNVSDFREVLAESFQDPLSFILFDSCLMLSSEVVYELRDVSKYVIGSPVEIPGPGAPYAELTRHFFEKDNCAVRIAESYFDIYNRDYRKSSVGWDSGVAIGVADCGSMQALAELTKTMIGKYCTDFRLNRGAVLKYDYSSQMANWDLEDLLCQMIGSRDSDDYKVWRNAFEDVMVFWTTTPTVYSALLYRQNWVGDIDMKAADGMACYLPTGDPNSHDNIFAQSLQWYRDAGWGLVNW